MVDYSLQECYTHWANYVIELRRDGSEVKAHTFIKGANSSFSLPDFWRSFRPPQIQTQWRTIFWPSWYRQWNTSSLGFMFHFPGRCGTKIRREITGQTRLKSTWHEFLTAIQKFFESSCTGSPVMSAPTIRI